ncbi:MAG: PQQ-dependent dehydrogenase, methanol/ethanol family [Acidobacteria bacterium]|nr:PQQ-dependent dehydrogenase, methanol/ethanol family [Acidobacteriota bacterium]
MSSRRVIGLVAGLALAAIVVLPLAVPEARLAVTSMGQAQMVAATQGAFGALDVVATLSRPFRSRDASTGVRGLFANHCATCHGPLGQGAFGPDLTNPRWHAERTDEQIATIIRQGVPTTAMPAFGTTLDDGDVAGIVRLLREWSRTQNVPSSTVTGPPVNVSPERLAAPAPDEWLMYGGDYGQRRFSSLASIDRTNVRRLVPAWTFQTGVQDGLAAMPLIVDGVIYLSTAWNHVFAIDARTGAEIWHYQRRLPAPKDLRYCCGPTNRGVAIWNDLVYVPTLDAHLVALDARTGQVRWDVELEPGRTNLNAKQPPLVVGNRLFIGVGGGDLPSRGFIDAYDAATGRRLWRFYTVPAPGEPGHETWTEDAWRTGGAAPWLHGTYDPETNLIYWGVGQPFPIHEGDRRPGDNLYSDSVVALDPETGAVRWHFQFTPHDLWDFDGTNENIPLEIDFKGARRKVIVHADRNGYFYAIDRLTGQFLFGKPYVRTTWTLGLTGEGRPLVDPKAIPSAEGALVCPGVAGGKQWNGMAYSPITRWLYLPVIENCATFYLDDIAARNAGLAGSGYRYRSIDAYGKVVAIDPATGDAKWEVRTRSPMSGSALATAGGLVFLGDAEGNIVAYDDRTGAKLWAFQTGSGIRSGPVMFRLDGVEYLAVASGMGGAVGMYYAGESQGSRAFRKGGTLFVFRLFDPDAPVKLMGASDSAEGAAAAILRGSAARP